MDKEQGQDAREDAAAAPIADNPTANRIADDIRERMSSLRPQAAEGAEHVADAAHQAAAHLRNEEAWLARLVDEGADQLTALAETLRTNDAQTLLNKTEEFARRQPVLFTGAAMALGFALARAASAATRNGAGQQAKEATDVRE